MSLSLSKSEMLIRKSYRESIYKKWCFNDEPGLSIKVDIYIHIYAL